MMRVAIFAWIFVLCLIRQDVLAADPPPPVYVTERIVTDRDADKPNDKAQVISYLIKRPKMIQRNSTVFYGVGARTSADMLKNQYTFFDKQFTDLAVDKTLSPIVVYVEQRYFGKSNTGEKIEALADLADLKLPNIVNDHVTLIQSLAVSLSTNNFLVFGSGYGGLVAGYVANKFATTDSLKPNYNVLGWSSSPPIKYLRQGNTALTGASLQDINTKAAELLTAPEVGCGTAEITKLNNLFKAIKAIRSDNTVFSRFKLTPQIVPPTAPSTGTDPGPNADLMELSVFVRKQIINLILNDSPFNADGTLLTARKLKTFCDKVKTLTGETFETSVQVDTFNDILAIFSGNDQSVNWKLVQDRDTTNAKWNQDLAATYYQDCTENQLVYCSTTSNTNSDPFRNSYWNNADGPCDTLQAYNTLIDAECTGLFGTTPITNRVPDLTKYPVSLNNRVITTIDTDSLFGKSVDKFGDADKSEKDYSFFWSLWGLGSWEFQAPRTCDNAKVVDIRYLVLKAFGCFASFIDPFNNVCDTATLFNDDVDKKPYDDAKPSLTVACPAETDAKKSVFPFGHAEVTLQNPVFPKYHGTSTIPPKSSAGSSSYSPGGKTTSQKPTTTTNGAESLIPMACILFSSLFLWTATLL